MHLLETVLAAVAGAVIAGGTLLSAVQTLAVPRSTPVLITRWIFVVTRVLFVPANRGKNLRTRDRRLALYGPLSLICLPVVWLGVVMGAFTLIFWATGVPWDAAFLESGSSLFTLGFRTPEHVGSAALAFTEAAMGLGLIALLISYLPSIYGSFSRRELLVTSLDTFAGSPPSGPALLERLADIHGLEELDGFWREWARWFAELEETHSSTPSLVYFRSPQPDRSWVTAAGSVLDAAALTASTLDVSRQPSAALCIRAGYLALRRIGDFFVMPYDPDPKPSDPIAVTRAEFDAVCDRLAHLGAPLRADLDQAWADFAGWRVTYEAVLLRFAALCWAPRSPWIGDRAIPFYWAPIRRRAARARI